MRTSTQEASTRERILDAAMTLFSERGFRGTSITQIEAAAGLTPGAGGIYHHFRTKQDLLQEGVQRHLSRLRALRDIRDLFSGVEDVRVELTLTARYALAELEREAELLRVLVAEARSHPELLQDAVDQLVNSTFAGFASWLREVAGVPKAQADAVSVLGLGALLSTRLMPAVFLTGGPAVPDDTIVATWVQMICALINDAKRA